MCSKWSDKNQIIQLTVNIVFDMFSWRPRLVLFICYMSNVIFKIDLVYTFVYNYFLCKATPFLQNEEKYLCGFKVKQNSNLNYLALHGGLSSITNSMFTRDLQKSNLVLIVRSIRMRPIIKYRLLLLLFFSLNIFNICNAYNYEINIW